MGAETSTEINNFHIPTLRVLAIRQISKHVNPIGLTRIIPELKDVITTTTWHSPNRGLEYSDGVLYLIYYYHRGGTNPRVDIVLRMRTPTHTENGRPIWREHGDFVPWQDGSILLQDWVR